MKTTIFATLTLACVIGLALGQFGYPSFGAGQSQGEGLGGSMFIYYVLTFITLWVNSVDEKLMVFSYFSHKTEFVFSCKLSPFACQTLLSVLGEIRKYFNMLSAEIVSQSTKH